MINPFTIHSKISKLQQDVLLPLYTMHPDQEKTDHEWLLVLTGRVIENNRPFLEGIAKSSLVAAVFKIVKLLGGAEELTDTDFNSFKSYINAGGLKAMVKMLLATDKYNSFRSELRQLPLSNRQNAHQMLAKSALLHQQFITEYLNDQYGSITATPAKLVSNFEKSTEFINSLAAIAHEEQNH
ncbi:hypothetical protein [Desulfosediminicola flagellatus]|uniref:hypothetical protein n=1 Tax=Desulfosediminicola flagellatus TaxID=2569541 RepID=UPI0010AD7D3E|nr:hypothetical protein [Desulfosediminicola flagellatus]